MLKLSTVVMFTVLLFIQARATEQSMGNYSETNRRKGRTKRNKTKWESETTIIRCLPVVSFVAVCVNSFEQV